MTATTVEPERLSGNLLTILEACEATRLSRSTVYQLLDSGRLASVRIPGVRARRIPRQAIESF